MSDPSGADITLEIETEKTNRQNAIRSSLASVLGVGWPQIIKTHLPDSHNFSRKGRDLYSILEWRDLLLEVPLENLPLETLTHLATVADRIQAALCACRDFRLTNASQGWDDPYRAATEQINRAAELLREDSVGRLGTALTIPLAKSVQSLTGNALAQLKKFEDAAEQNVARTTQASQRAESLLVQLEERTQSMTVAEQAKVFSERADAHERGSTKWLIAAGAMATAGLLLGVVIAFPRLVGLEYPQGSDVWPATAGRVLLFSILLAGALWCGRVYRAHRHNEEVNRHRANALSTFQLFADAADPETRAYILRQATGAIFAPQPTAFIQSDGESTPGMQVVEILSAMKRDA